MLVIMSLWHYVFEEFILIGEKLTILNSSAKQKCTMYQASDIVTLFNWQL